MVPAYVCFMSGRCEAWRFKARLVDGAAAQKMVQQLALLLPIFIVIIAITLIPSTALPDVNVASDAIVPEGHTHQITHKYC